MSEEINANVNEGTENKSNKNTQEDSKTYTQEEVVKLIQMESDKRVSQALKTQEKKFQKELSLSKLDGEAREAAEKDNRIAELEQQLAQFTIEKNKSDLKSTLSSRGLSAEFADLLNITDDTESNQKIISEFDKLFKKAVTAEVENRIGNNAQPKRNMLSPDVMTKDAFNKMSMRDQQEYLNRNPEWVNVMKSW